MSDMIDDETALSDPRVRAFLRTIRTLEHSPQAVARGDDYTTFYGGGHFTDLTNHPVLTGEMRGVPLPRAMCIAAGYSDGVCVSTAAGAYQFIVPTWSDVRGISPRLPDFSVQSQDIAAVRLLKKTGALQSVLSDDIDGALRLASSRWASLPYSTARQNPKSIMYALSTYQRNLGV
jgi:muramidase (phage lysozyme)